MTTISCLLDISNTNINRVSFLNPECFENYLYCEENFNKNYIGQNSYDILLLDDPKNRKMKSQLCRNFLQSGYCPYGNRCQFAHGKSELRCNSEYNGSYKTKQCNAFYKNGFCKYGQRCNFIHLFKRGIYIRQKDIPDEQIKILLRESRFQRSQMNFVKRSQK